jgi:hypothetical protein
MLPFGGGCPFDLVAATEDGVLIRIQVKTGWGEGGCIAFNTHSTDHGRGPGSYRGKADLFGVYFASLDQVYLVPVDSVGTSECRLRIDPPKNNQRRRVNMAEDFRIERWTDDAIRGIVCATSGEQQPALTG